MAADAASTEQGLQRSEISFRRQGSSGLVWDDKFLSGELNLDLNHQHDHHATGESRMSKSDSGRHGTYRALKVEAAPEDPPSPRISGCGFCGTLRKTAVARQRKHRKHRM